MTDKHDGFDPELTYSLAFKAMRLLTRGRSIGIREVDDLANDVAWRVIQKARIQGIEDLNRFIWGVARRVLLEALRAEQKEPLFQPICDVPELDTYNELPPILDQYIEQFRSNVPMQKLRILDDALYPNGRKKKEIAALHNLSESAFSKTMSRLNSSAEAFHRDFVQKLFNRILSEGSEELDNAILTVARTPQERADYQLRLVHSWQLRSVMAVMSVSERATLLGIPKSKLITLVAKCTRENADIGFRSETRCGIARQYMLEGRPSDAATCILNGIAEATSAGAKEVAIMLTSIFTYPMISLPPQTEHSYPSSDSLILEFLAPVAFALPTQRSHWTHHEYQQFAERVVEKYDGRNEPGLRQLAIN